MCVCAVCCCVSCVCLPIAVIWFHISSTYAGDDQLRGSSRLSLLTQHRAARPLSVWLLSQCAPPLPLGTPWPTNCFPPWLAIEQLVEHCAGVRHLVQAVRVRLLLYFLITFYCPLYKLLAFASFPVASCRLPRGGHGGSGLGLDWTKKYPFTCTFFGMQRVSKFVQRK